MDPENLGILIFYLNRTMNNKLCSQAESPRHLHNNNTLILFLQQISSLSPIGQISEILRLVPEQHSQAVSLFNLCKQPNAKELAKKLVELIEHSPLLEVRAMSAILLPNTLLQKPSKLRPSLWNTLPKLRSSVNLGLLNCVVNEQNKPIIIILANTISKLTADNRFPELWDFMLKGFKNVGWLKESALLIFAQLGEQYVKDHLVQRQKDLHGVFKDCLENGDIRITALSAVIKFINCLELSDRRSFKDLRPLMFRCVTQELNEATAQEALVLLIELARTKWTFFTYGGWPMFLGIAEAERFEEGTRHLVIEVVITTVEEKKCNLLEPDINSLCAILMRMLLNIEDEAAWYSAENEDEDEDAGRSSNYIFGKQCLHRLATALGGNTIVPVVYDYLSAPNDQWKNHLAGLVALAQIAKRLSKLVMIPNLEQLVTRVLNSIESHPDHPRVRWVAINAIGELCADLDPDLQSEYHSVIPALVKAMGEDRDSRVRLAAIKAAGQLLADLDPDLQFEYNSDVLLTLVKAIREDPDQRVRLAAINVTVQLFADLDPNLQFQNHWRVLPTLTEAMRKDPDQRVRVAAINEAGQLFADLDPKLQLENHLPVLLTLVKAIREDPDQRVRLAAINVTVQLFADLDPNLTLKDEGHVSVLKALRGAIYEFEYLLVQERAVDAMISISIYYLPDVMSSILVETVGTLLEHRRREDIASDQTRIHAIRTILAKFERELPRGTWTSTFNSLSPEQRAEFR